jgi:hypothetical protein
MGRAIWWVMGVASYHRQPIHVHDAQLVPFTRLVNDPPLVQIRSLACLASSGWRSERFQRSGGSCSLQEPNGITVATKVF